MGTMRILLGDRWSGGLLAVLTAVFVLLQGFASAQGCAASIAGTGRVSLVICHGAGVTTVEGPGPGPGSETSASGCLCGTLCCAGVAFTVAAPGPAPGRAYSPRDGIDLRFARHSGRVPAPYPSEAPPFPTGPPAASA